LLLPWPNFKWCKTSAWVFPIPTILSIKLREELGPKRSTRLLKKGRAKCQRMPMSTRSRWGRLPMSRGHLAVARTRGKSIPRSSREELISWRRAGSSIRASQPILWLIELREAMLSYKGKHILTLILP
jgi:hypothetical protein